MKNLSLLSITVFLEANNFEDTISISEDVNTIATITGLIAEAHFSIPEKISKNVLLYLMNCN
ncbi:MAG TPA: hypothetical protein PLI14_00055 [Bacilli bacterium]|jgi:ADP-ribosylglycohydrolase|nr:hypothetical protein [Bacilli bacterium]HQM06642.1 hypothetical protein [Bacilli bacterium]